MHQFVSVKGRDLVCGKQPVQFRGVNVGNYLLIEHFMIGLYSTEEQLRKNFHSVLGAEKTNAFFDAYIKNYFTEKDAQFLAELGLNCIRLPFHHRHFIDDHAPSVIKEQGFSYLDHVIALCRKYGIYILLDFHAVPGCQARDWNSESAFGEIFFWERTVYQDQLAMLWKAIAARYRNEPVIFGYDLIGEPVCPDPDLFHSVNMRLVREIRKVDINHIIAVESNFWGKKIESLRDELFEDPLVLPSFHHYPVQFPPFNSIEKYPGEYNGAPIGKSELIETLKQAYDVDRVMRPHIAGEFGMRYKKNPGAFLPIIDDCMEFFEKMKFPWMIWSYKDIGEMGLVRPKPETAWLKFVKSEKVVSLLDTYHIGQEAFFKAIDPLLPQNLEIPEALYPAYSYEMRRAWHRLLLPHVVAQLKECDLGMLEKMACSFAFENCIPREEMCSIICKYTKRDSANALRLF